MFDSSEKRERHGLSLRVMNLVIGVIAVVIAVALLLVTQQVSASYTLMSEANADYVQKQEAAHELQSASDYLTEQARAFAATGERQYLYNYYTEATASRRREKALAALGDSEEKDSYQRLENALRKSDELMDLEYSAMKLTMIACGYSLEGLPSEIIDAGIDESLLALSAEEQRLAAEDMVLGGNYQKQKTEINREIRLCLSALIDETEHDQQEAQRNLHVLLITERVLIFLLIGAMILTIVTTSCLIINPLISGVDSIRGENLIPVRGASEFRFLARTYNGIFSANKKQREQLAFEASHDMLTGVYNRLGCEQLVTDADLGGTALLIIDVDNFKQVNDRFGHQTGDSVLKRTAAVLREHFAKDDIVSRIGGDEFAILVKDAESDSADEIAEKIADVNDTISRGEGRIPASSISVGCAFGESGEKWEDLFRKADLALYRVKRAGRCGVSFAKS